MPESTRAGAVVTRIRRLFRKAENVKQYGDINALILDLVSLLRDEAMRRNIYIRTELTSNPLRVQMDPVQIQQVLLNLAMNGMDSMAEVTNRPRELIIRSGTDGSALTVQVEDRGTGLPPEVAERMFDAFFTTKPNGLGMGLSISRSIIEDHDGHLWATAKEPFGTMFQFTIPIQS